jgi:hypothetical protein
MMAPASYWLFWAPTATFATVIWKCEGTITSISAQSSSSGVGFCNLGVPFHVTYVYDSSVPS